MLPDWPRILNCLSFPVAGTTGSSHRARPSRLFELDLRPWQNPSAILTPSKS